MVPRGIERDQHGQRRNADPLGRRRDVVGGSGPREDGLEGFREGDRVEGDGNRLGQVERDADGAADRGSEGPADDEIGTTPGHAPVRGDLGNRQHGGNRHHVPDDDDQHGKEGERPVLAGAASVIGLALRPGPARRRARMRMPRGCGRELRFAIQPLPLLAVAGQVHHEDLGVLVVQVAPEHATGVVVTPKARFVGANPAALRAATHPADCRTGRSRCPMEQWRS